jgi:hypothetical protein
VREKESDVMVEKEDVEPADRRSQILARAIVDQLAGTPMEDGRGAIHGSSAYLGRAAQ